MLDRKDQVSFVAKPCFLPIAKLWRAETPRRAGSTGKQAACESKRLRAAAGSRSPRLRLCVSGVRWKLESLLPPSPPSDKRHRFHQVERCRSWHGLPVPRESPARQSVGQLSARYCRSILRKISCSTSSASETFCKSRRHKRWTLR